MGCLDGKVVLITGSCYGIGRAAVYKFIEEGAKVVFNGLDTELDHKRAEEMLATIKNMGGEAAVVFANLEDVSTAQKLFDYTIEQFGTIDVLVNHGGKNVWTTLKETTVDGLLDMCHVHIVTPLLLTTLCGYYMKEKGSGAIVNTGSWAGLHASLGVPAYAATKAALIHLTKGSAIELGPSVRVNCICPGTTLSAPMDGAPQELIDSEAEKVVLKKCGLPEDIANAMLFFASDKFAHITGQVLSCDGGIYL